MARFNFFSAVALCSLALQVSSLTMGGKPNQMIKPYKREVLQDIVCSL